MTTGLPFTLASVSLLPWLLATTRVLPLALGVGSVKGTVMTRFLPTISAFMFLTSFISLLAVPPWNTRSTLEPFGSVSRENVEHPPRPKDSAAGVWSRRNPHLPQLLFQLLLRVGHEFDFAWFDDHGVVIRVFHDHDLVVVGPEKADDLSHEAAGARVAEAVGVNPLAYAQITQ